MPMPIQMTERVQNQEVRLTLRKDEVNGDESKLEFLTHGRVLQNGQFRTSFSQFLGVALTIIRHTIAHILCNFRKCDSTENTKTNLVKAPVLIL